MNKIILCLLALISIVAYALLSGGEPPAWTPSLWFLVIPVMIVVLAFTAFLFYCRDSVGEFFDRPSALYRYRAAHALVTLWFLSPILGNGTAVLLRWVGYPEAASVIWELRYLPLAGAIAGGTWILSGLIILLCAVAFLCAIWVIVRDIVRSCSKKTGSGCQLA